MLLVLACSPHGCVWSVCTWVARCCWLLVGNCCVVRVPCFSEFIAVLLFPSRVSLVRACKCACLRARCAVLAGCCCHSVAPAAMRVGLSPAADAFGSSARALCGCPRRGRQGHAESLIPSPSLNFTMNRDPGDGGRATHTAPPGAALRRPWHPCPAERSAIAELRVRTAPPHPRTPAPRPPSGPATEPPQPPTPGNRNPAPTARSAACSAAAQRPQGHGAGAGPAAARAAF